MKRYSSLLISLLSVAVLSCSKKDTQPTLTMQSIAGTYKLMAMTAKDNAGQILDVYARLSDCEKDDLDVLYSNSAYEHVDAGIQCNPPGNQTASWSLSGNQITLGNTTATVVSYNGRQLIISFPYNDSGTDYTITETYAKQ